MAPFCDGTNQPSSRSPSLVVKETSSGVGAEVRGRDDRPRRVRDDVPDRDRHQERRNQHDDAGENEAAAQVAAAAAVVGAPRPPERPDADAEQDEAAGQREEAGEVVAGGAVGEGVVDGLDAGEDAEEAEQQREGGAGTGADAPVCPGAGRDERQEREPSRKVVDRRHAGLGLQEVVVGDVEPDEADRGERETPLGGVARRPRCARGSGPLRRSCSGRILLCGGRDASKVAGGRGPQKAARQVSTRRVCPRARVRFDRPEFRAHRELVE